MVWRGLLGPSLFLGPLIFRSPHVRNNNSRSPQKFPLYNFLILKLFLLSTRGTIQESPCDLTRLLLFNALKNKYKSLYLIRINFRADKISRKFAQRRPYARNLIRELRAERSCAKINPREKISQWKMFMLVPILWLISRVLEYICLGCKKLNPRENFQHPGCAKNCPRENLYE